jgi:phenylpropionate dioxygenase-like ring-hydroxylating dioxygenase large terminal subunit
VNGRCVEVPGQPEVPSGAKVRAYPTHEKNNVVWIWMGDADKADTAKIPDLPVAVRSEMGGDTRPALRQDQLSVHHRQPARSDPRRPRPQEDHRRRSARGDDTDQDRAPA